MPEEVDAHVLRKYELVERLGKGVRSPACSPALLAGATWLDSTGEGCPLTIDPPQPRLTPNNPGAVTQEHGPWRPGAVGLKLIIPTLVRAGIWGGMEGCGEGQWPDSGAQEDLRRVPERH